MCQEVDRFEAEEKTRRLSEESLQELAREYELKPGDGGRSDTVIAMCILEKNGLDQTDERALDIITDVLKGRIASSKSREPYHESKSSWREISRDCASGDQS